MYAPHPQRLKDIYRYLQVQDHVLAPATLLVAAFLVASGLDVLLLPPATYMTSNFFSFMTHPAFNGLDVLLTPGNVTFTGVGPLFVRGQNVLGAFVCLSWCTPSDPTVVSMKAVIMISSCSVPGSFSHCSCKTMHCIAWQPCTIMQANAHVGILCKCWGGGCFALEIKPRLRMLLEPLSQEVSTAATCKTQVARSNEFVMDALDWRPAQNHVFQGS